MQSQRVVIIGGGFGGLNAAKALCRRRFDVTLIDRRNFHLFQPLLYQVATGSLSPANIASPLRAIFKSCPNVEVLLAEVTDIDPARREVVTREERVPYDALVVATGSSHYYFGHPEWEANAPSLKTIEDATEVRRRVLLGFEMAELEIDAQLRAAWLTFVVVGAGPTGVELAGAIAELSRHTLRGDFHRIDPATARIILVEGVDHVLPAYSSKLSASAAKSLESLGVSLRLGAMVTDVDGESVTLRTAAGEERIQARTVLWAAGVMASPLGRVLEQRAGAKLDRAGRVIVQPDLSIAGHEEIFVIGDLCHYGHQTSAPLPGLAPVAMQQGRYVAGVLRRRGEGRGAPPFRYHDRGTMATIGRAKAVADIFGIQFAGFFAWVVWLFVHLMYLVGFRNRVLVLLQWAWSYTTRNVSARLITSGKPASQALSAGKAEAAEEVQHGHVKSS